MGSLGSLIPGITSSWGVLKGAVGDTALAHIALAGGASGLTLVIASLIIAIAAAAAFFIAIATNAWGFRDAIEGVGKSVGNAVPVLQPLLEGIQGIGGALMLTGENADQTAEHLKRASFGFSEMSTLWNDTVASMQQSNLTFVQDMGNTFSQVNIDTQKAMGDFAFQVQASITTWGLFVDAIKKEDYKGAVDIIQASFAAIPGIIGTILGEANKVFSTWIQGIGQTMIDLGKFIGQKLTEAGNAIYPIIAGIGAEVAKRFMAELRKENGGP